MSESRKKLVSTWKKGQSGNPAGRPKGIPNPQAKLRKMIDAEGIVKALQKKALTGNTQAAELLLERALPPLRAVAEPVMLPGLANAATLTAKAECIVALTAAGRLSPDVATAMLGAIGQLAKTTEIDELTRRLEALEKANGKVD
jgi:DNA-binding response OmpR family regulator